MSKTVSCLLCAFACSQIFGSGALAESFDQDQEPEPLQAMPQTLDSMIGTAKHLYYSGDMEGAQAILHTALAKADDGSATFSTCLQNLALIEYMNFNFQEAEKLYLQALPITESIWGADSIATANNLYGLSRCLRRSRRYAEAEPYLNRILKIRTHLLGSDNRLVSNSLLDIAVNCQWQNKMEEALSYSSRAVEAREKELGKDSPFLVPTLKLYATILHSANSSRAPEVDARIETLTIAGTGLVEPSRKRDESGGQWQDLRKSP